MHAGRRYTFRELFFWTFGVTKWLMLIAIIPTVFFAFGFRFFVIPWQPVALLGTALSFIVGFKNNASYGRLWEARQIYGAIINDSRSFGYTVRDTLGGKNAEIVRNIIYRHIAWLTALRFQLREYKSWENTKERKNIRFRNRIYKVPEWESTLEKELSAYLSQEELTYILGKKNKATQLAARQSEIIIQQKKEGKIDDFEWTQLQQILQKLTEHQGKAERIKNFPYPRNFATITTYLMFLFVFIVPFGLISELDKLGKGTGLEGYYFWLNIPISALLSWAFYTLDQVGESSVNPFEGNSNDVPITQISRAIEIDLRDMLDENNLPEPILPQNNIIL